MKYVEKPNLPLGDVRFALVAQSVDSGITTELNRLGIDLFSVKSQSEIFNSTGDHPDISFLHLGKNLILSASGENISYKSFSFDCRKIPERIREKYPEDVPLNCAIIGSCAFCNSKFASKELLDSDFSIVDVRQGYAKCSTAVVSEDAIITEDRGIAIASEAVGINALLIKAGGVALSGYNYGFLGGACGKINRDCLAFFGNIESHPEYTKIKSFCENHGVITYSLSKAPLYDYGGILPLIEA